MTTHKSSQLIHLSVVGIAYYESGSESISMFYGEILIRLSAVSITISETKYDGISMPETATKIKL